MLKKTIWSVIIVLIATCSIFLTQTGFEKAVLPAAPTAALITEQPKVCIELTSTPWVVTATPRYTTTPKPTNTPSSTAVPTKTPTKIVASPTATKIAPTATKSAMTFEMQAGSPVFTKNFAHPEAGCNWQGVAGQVFSNTGKPLYNYIIRISGMYNAKQIIKIGVTGSVVGNPYGPQSYEVVLGNSVVQSLQLLTIQLYNSNGVAVSDPYLFNTSAFCTKNLEIINFKQK